MQEVCYGRIMREINLTGNLAHTQSPHVSTWSRLIHDQDMPSVCIPPCGLRILCQWNLGSGFLERNSGFLNPGNPDFESNNNPYYLTWGDALSYDRFRFIEKSLQQTFLNPYGRHRARFPSSPGSLYQNKCSTFDIEMIFHSHASKTHFHKKGCALGLILKVRVFGTRKWLISFKYSSGNFQVK